MPVKPHEWGLAVPAWTADSEDKTTPIGLGWLAERDDWNNRGTAWDNYLKQEKRRGKGGRSWSPIGPPKRERRTIQQFRIRSRLEPFQRGESRIR